MDAEERKAIVDIWKTIVDVQKHFNDIEMKIRGFFISMVVGVAAAQGFLMDKGLAMEIGSVKILYATFIPLIGILGTFLFYFMDKHWYHRLLVGAVLHAIKIETAHKGTLPELSLSASVGEASPVKLKGWITKKVAGLVIADPKYKNTKMLHSDGKIELFYKPIAVLFFMIFVATVLFTGVFVDKHPLAFAIWHGLTSAFRYTFC